MRIHRLKQSGPWFLMAVAILGFSCGGCDSGPAKVPVVLVEAKLILDDKPFGPATISLSPTKPEAKLPPATGIAAADGKLDLRSYAGKSGIAPGEYTVALMPDPMKIASSPTADTVKVTIDKVPKPMEIKLTSKKVRPGTPLGSPP